jgi:glycosyltransferase involved in cell wall biosynthesis
MNSKVSVVIPVYNGEKTLTKCINSVLNQTYMDYEIIVVDNNSIDKTKRIINYFEAKNKKIKYVFEGFRSRGAARNVGIKFAKGEIIAMTDADCIVPDDWIEKITFPIRKNKELIVQGNEFNANKGFFPVMEQEFNQNFLKKHIYGNHINHLDTKNFAILKRVFENIKFDCKIKNLEDYDLKMQMKKRGIKIYFARDVKVKHFHPETFSSFFKKKIDRGYWATKIFFKYNFLIGVNEEMTKSINTTNFISFFPWLFVFLIRNGAKKFIYESISGIAWRIGIMLCLLKK